MTVRSAIIREDTETLSVVRLETLLVDDTLISERERVERDGYAKGYASGSAAGHAEVLAAAEASRTAQDCALRALNTAVHAAEGMLETERDRLQHAAAELAFQIAEAVLARELQLSSSPGLDAVPKSPRRVAGEQRGRRPDEPRRCRVGRALVRAQRSDHHRRGPGGGSRRMRPRGRSRARRRANRTALARVRKVLDEATGKS